MLSTLGLYLARNQGRVVLMVTPNDWLKHQNRELFEGTMQESFLRDPEELAATTETSALAENEGVVCCLTHTELLKIPKAVMRKATVLLDEAHLMLPEPVEDMDPAVYDKLFEADRICAVSATLGDSVGILKAKRKLHGKKAFVACLNPPGDLQATRQV